MKQALNAAITPLLVSALDAAGFADSAWHTQLKIPAARVARIRSGRSPFSDAELSKISQTTGEPWQKLILAGARADDALTADTRQLLAGLRRLGKAADVEANDHPKAAMTVRRKKRVAP